MIKFKVAGDYKKTRRFFKNVLDRKYLCDLDKYGQEGVKLLSAATPVDTGETASSWRYEVVNQDGSYKIHFINDNVVNGCNVVILLQYGHATRNDGYVEGIDFINPAIKPLFIKLAEDAWKEVKSA